MNMPTTNATQPICVAALYRFARLDGLNQLRVTLQQLCRERGIKGTLLVASERINGTIAGSSDGIASVLGYIRIWPGCADLDVKVWWARAMPFHRMKVPIKREIVTSHRSLPSAALCRARPTDRGDLGVRTVLGGQLTPPLISGKP